MRKDVRRTRKEEAAQRGIQGAIGVPSPARRSTNAICCPLNRDFVMQPSSPARAAKLESSSFPPSSFRGARQRKPKPFVWTANSDRIIEKVSGGYQAIASNY